MNWKHAKSVSVLAPVLIFALTAIGILLNPWLVSAMTVTASWTFDEANQSKISGFRIYNANHAVIVDNIARTSRTITFDVDSSTGSPQAWYVAAYKDYTEGDDEVSWPSNIIQYCPDRMPPPSPSDAYLQEAVPSVVAPELNASDKEMEMKLQGTFTND